MVGASINRKLNENNGINIVTADSSQLDLRRQDDTEQFLKMEKPDIVIIAAAKVGGIVANNNFPADFIYDNLMISCNIIRASYLHGVKTLLQLGSSCIYPKNIHRPIRESDLLSGYLEETNEPYALAKISAIKLCESYNRQHGLDYRSLMPCNLYGRGDNFHTSNSHVLPALIRRFHEAKLKGEKAVSIWGTGTPKREFLHVDDLAEAVLFCLSLSKESFFDAENPIQSHINVGFGEDISISDLAELIAGIVGFKGVINNDLSKPDGVTKKLLDSTRINSMGWRPKIELEEGIAMTYSWYLENLDALRK